MTRAFSTGSTKDPEMTSLEHKAPRTGRSCSFRLALMVPALIVTAATISSCADSRDRMTTSAIMSCNICGGSMLQPV